MQQTEMKSPGRDAIEAYLSEDGHICLRQTSEMDHESIIMLLPHDIPQVVEWLQGLAGKVPAAGKERMEGAIKAEHCAACLNPPVSPPT